MSNLRPVVLSGPSGCGKSTLIKKLMEVFPNKFGFSVSHTTRGMRPGEVANVSYHFTTREDMQTRIDNGEFIEHAVYSNNLYGTSKKAVNDVRDAGKICILDIDSQGVKAVKEIGLNCLLLFIKPPSLAELENRLRGRQTETEEAIQLRLNQAHIEQAYADTPNAYHHHIVNEDLEQAFHKLREILQNEYPDLKATVG